MLYRLLEKLPLSQGGKVALGTALCLGLCSVPMLKSKSAFAFAPSVLMRIKRATTLLTH